MTEFLRSWVLGLTGAALLCAAAEKLTPKGRVRSIVHLLGGVILSAALFAPLLEAVPEDYGLNLALYRESAAAVSASGEEIARTLDRRIIEEQTEAYILDKARSLGAEIGGAKVTLEWSTEGLWYPVAADLDGPYHGGLSGILEAELGIPASRQSWREA